MVTLDTSHKALERVIGKKIPLKELEEVLFGLGFELDEVNGDELKIDVTPDRIDALSTIGMGRILANYLELKKPATYTAKKSEYVVEVSAPKEWPFTVCAVVKNLRLDDASLKDIIYVQEKLASTLGRGRKKAGVGVYPLEKITWPINYEGRDPAKISFTPLGANKAMNALQILETHETGKKYAHLVTHFKKFPVFVDRADQILSMPPILNSESFGRVTTKTTDCFIEVTGLDLVNITRMLDIICCVFADMGGDIYQVQIKMGAKKLVTPAFSAKKVSISTKQIATRMGVELSAKEVGVLLEKMGYHIVSHKTSAKNTSFELTAPCYRGDIWHDVDIIDDIIRAYGVNNIPMRFPAVATTGGVTNRTRVVDAVTDILVGHGLVEIRTLGVTDKADQFDKMNLGAMPHISLGSTADKGINMVRCGLLAESLKLLSHNRSVPTPHKIFEVGDVLIPDAKADVRSRNVTKLCVVLGGDGITYTNARQVLESLLSDFGLLTAVTYAAQKHPSFIDGRCADVLVHGKSIGILGEISVKVLENWGFEYPIACFEIDLSTLI